MRTELLDLRCINLKIIIDRLQKRYKHINQGKNENTIQRFSPQHDG